MRSVHAGLLGLIVFTAAVSAGCSNADVEPTRQQNVVGVADVRTGSVGTTKIVRTTVTSTKTVDRAVTRAKTVTAAPRTVTVTVKAKTVTGPARTVAAPAHTVTAAPRTNTVTVVQTETEAPVVPQGLADTSSVYFANCAAARAAGAAPVRAGDPGYRSALDRDGDGIGCE